MCTETNIERRRRQNRESMARRYATPEGREQLKANNKRWRTSEAGKSAVNEAKARQRRKYPADMMFRSSKARARLQDVPFTLSRKQFDQLLEPMRCSVTGVALSWEWDGPSKKNPWAPSLDRIRAGEGYTPDNVRLTCWAFNCARADWGDGVVRVMAEGLLQNG